MTIVYSPEIIRSGLHVYLDPGNKRCYSGTGSTCYNLVSGAPFTMTRVKYDNNFGGRFMFSDATSASWTWINLGNSQTLGTVPNTGYTMDAWIRTPGFGRYMNENGIMTITYGIRIYLTASGYLQSVADNTVMGAAVPSSVLTYTGNTNLHDNKWHHICVTNDRKIHRMFIDGVMKLESIASTAPTAGYFGNTRWPTSNTAIGVDINNNNLCFNGDISCAKIYKRALEIEEVYQNYNAHKLRFNI